MTTKKAAKNIPEIIPDHAFCGAFSRAEDPPTCQEVTPSELASHVALPRCSEASTCISGTAVERQSRGAPVGSVE
jgi:hypothetical protein